MKQNSIDELVNRFTNELSTLVREKALDAARNALGSPSSALKTRSFGVKAPSTGAISQAKSGDRSAQGVGDLGARLLEQLRAQPHLRTEQLGVALGVSTVHIKPLLAKLLAAGTVKKRGQRRGTQYSVA